MASQFGLDSTPCDGGGVEIRWSFIAASEACQKNAWDQSFPFSAPSRKSLRAASESTGGAYALRLVVFEAPSGFKPSDLLSDICECPHLDSNQGPTDYEGAGLARIA
jgi:hypothetical protein